MNRNVNKDMMLPAFLDSQAWFAYSITHTFTCLARLDQKVGYRKPDPKKLFSHIQFHFCHNSWTKERKRHEENEIDLFKQDPGKLPSIGMPEVLRYDVYVDLPVFFIQCDGICGYRPAGA
jgi:hypothetical protein